MSNPRPVNFVVHTPEGKIISTGSAPLQYVALQGELTIVCGPEVLDSTHWVSAGNIAARVALGATWDTQQITGNEEATLSGLPIPCTVYVDETPVVVLDGTFEFSAASPGDYRVSVNQLGYLRQEWIIDAN